MIINMNSTLSRYVKTYWIILINILMQLDTHLLAEEIDNKELLHVISSGNQSSIESIETYFAEIILEQRPGSGFQDEIEKNRRSWIRKAEYWRDRKRIRIREHQGYSGKTIDVEIIGGRAKTIPTYSNGKHTVRFGDSGAIIATKDRRFTDTDAWELSLFSLPVGTYTKPPHRIFTLTEAIQDGVVKTLEWTKIHGQRLIHLNIEIPGNLRSYEIWVDPSRNWLITRSIHNTRPKPDGGPLLFNLEYQVEEWAEPKPSIYVPIKISHKSIFRGKVISESIATFNNIRVNEQMKSLPSMPNLERGTLVADEIRGGVFTVDDVGKQQGKFIPWIGSFEPALPAPDPFAPSKWSAVLGWLLIGVAIFLICLAIYYVLRRRSSLKAANTR